MRHELFPASELGPSEMRRVQIGRTGIVVLRTADGRLHALRDRCSHMGAKLSVGWLRRPVLGTDLGVCKYSDSYVVRCPWHYYEFDVETGRCIADPERDRVKAYEVTEEDGTVVLSR